MLLNIILDNMMDLMVIKGIALFEPKYDVIPAQELIVVW